MFLPANKIVPGDLILPFRDDVEYVKVLTTREVKQNNGLTVRQMTYGDAVFTCESDALIRVRRVVLRKGK